MRHLWRWFLARFRLDLEAVCEMSKGKADYHDYPDDRDGHKADHFVQMTCRRCGKKFYI